MCGIATLTIVMSITSRMAVSTTATTSAIEGVFSGSVATEGRGGEFLGGLGRFDLGTRRFM